MLVELVQSEAALAKTPDLVLVAPERRAAEQGGWEVGGGQGVGRQRLSWAKAAPCPASPGRAPGAAQSAEQGPGLLVCRCSQLVLSPLSKMRCH